LTQAINDLRGETELIAHTRKAARNRHDLQPVHILLFFERGQFGFTNDFLINGCKAGTRLRKRNSRVEARHNRDESGRITAIRRRKVKIRIDSNFDTRETGRRDADDPVDLVFEWIEGPARVCKRNCLPDYGWVRCKLALPVCVTENRHGTGRCAIAIRARDQAADIRANAEHRKIIRGDGLA